MSDSTSISSASIKGKSIGSIDTNRQNKGNQDLGIIQMLKNAIDENDETIDMKTLLPISILLEEMKSDNSNTRTYCLQNLSTIALVLGPVKAKGLLGGFISNLLIDQDKGVEDVPEELQVMLTLLESMPKLINLIGGPENSIVILQPLLETFADRTKDETKNMYIKILRDIGQRMQRCLDLFEKCVTESIILLKYQPEQKEDEEIINKDIREYEQCAAIGLIANLYNLISKNKQEEWLNYFNDLMLSSNTQVRKRAVLSLKEFGQWANNEDDYKLCLSLADNIFTKGKDFKSNLFYSLPIILKAQGYEDYVKKLFTMQNINAYNCFLEVFIECLQVLQNKNDCKIFIEQFFKLFTKQEIEVKQKLALYCGKLVIYIKESKTIYKGYLTQLQQELSKLELEKNYLIKQNLVESITLILNQATDRRIYYQQEEIQYYVRFLMNQLITGDSDLQFKFISKQKSFNLILQFISDNAFNSEESSKHISNLLLVISKVEGCKNWRMKQQCLLSLQMFIANLQTYQLFKSFDSKGDEVELIKKLLQDRISIIREEAHKTLQQLLIAYKINNMIKEGKFALEKLKDLLQHQNYLVRVNFVLGLRESLFLGDSAISLLKSIKNEVPNVKLALMEVILNNRQYKLLDLLPLKDEDPDVRDVAQLIYQQFK